MNRLTAPFAVMLFGSIAVGADLPRVPPTDPAHAESTFRCQGGFSMHLLAAEPLVTDPVAMAYDEDGRAYVCEMNDYPYTDANTHQAWKENTTDAPIGKVRLLIDADGDGNFDRSTVFADQLSWPTGVACYKGGVFVCATPDVWYFKDTNADGVADVERKIFTGFRKYNVQAVMNNLVWGLDNKLYGAGGSNGGAVRPGEHNESKFEPLTLARNDFRFDPATERIELIPGGARFGNTFDDYGNRFVCNIRNPAQHVVIDDLHYLTRNPHAPIASVVHDVARSGDALPVFRISPLEAWRDVRANRFVKEQTKQPRSELVAGGVVTSASGVTVYRGDAYPPEFGGMLFLGEVANNLIHRQRMKPAGVTFTSSRVDEKVEFVASTDVWFRPVNFVNAPDGTLHVLDMYREVIEHPWSIPDDIRAKLDLRSGADRGRIYRLAPKGFKVPKPPRLSGATTAELVAAVANPNAWWRETGQRLLVERQDKSAIKPLGELLTTSKEPLARLHAMWTLEGLGAAVESDISHAVEDPTPGVRANAIRLAERRLTRSTELRDAVIHAARNDDDARVQFQAILTAGGAPAGGPLVELLTDLIQGGDADDPWIAAAVVSASGDAADRVINRLSLDTSWCESPARRALVRKLAAVAGARDRIGGFADFAETEAADLPAKLEVLIGYGEGLRRNGRALWGFPSPKVRELFGEAARVAADMSANLDDRIRAVEALRFEEFARTKDLIARLLNPTHPPSVQRAALSVLAGVNEPDIGPLLLARWRSYTPAMKAEVIQAMFAYPNRLPALMDALDAGTVAVNDVPPARRPALLNHANESLRWRAEKLFGKTPSQSNNRKEAIAQYARALELKGDPAAGRVVFESACATCHKLGDKGFDVGPNLATVRQWSGEQLLTNILDPNREVAPAFVEYVVQMKDGETLSGVVAEETGNSLTLKLPGGAERVLPRQSVKRIAASKLSLMPEGLEAGITPQQMVDLIAFVRGGGQ